MFGRKLDWFFQPHSAECELNEVMQSDTEHSSGQGEILTNVALQFQGKSNLALHSSTAHHNKHNYRDASVQICAHYVKYM